jgi:cytochrome c oxidase cbb3-type subunit 3
MINPRTASPLSGRRAGLWAGATAATLLLLAAVGMWALQLRRAQLQVQLLGTDANAVMTQPRLVRLALEQAKPLYTANCASCHGADLRGNTVLGAPNLTDSVWLYGSGSVFDIERTLLYGVRSGLSKSHNVTDMPAFGTSGVLSPADIRNLVQYVLQLSGRPHETEAAGEGRSVYFGKANCADCHGADGRGNGDYGAPDLTAGVFDSGDSNQALYAAVYFGEHRVMPAWIGSLSLEQIRALALYVYAASHHP